MKINQADIVRYLSGMVIFFLLTAFIFNRNLQESIIHTLMFAIFYLILDLSLKFFKHKSQKANLAANNTPISSELITEFVAALGGQANIVSVDSEVSRVKIELHSPDELDAEKIKRLELDGVFVTGNIVQATFGDQANAIAARIHELI